jgi:hypothetical protein
MTSLLVTVQLRFDETDVEAVAHRITPLVHAAIAIQGEHLSVSIQDYDDENDDA